MYFYIGIGIIVLAIIAVFYYYRTRNVEAFADLSGVIVDLSGNPFRDPDGNILLIEKQHIDYLNEQSKVPLTPVQQEAIDNYKQNPDTRPLTDEGRQCDLLLNQFKSTVSMSEKYRDAGDWKTYRINLNALNKMKDKLKEMNCVIPEN